MSAQDLTKVLSESGKVWNVRRGGARRKAPQKEKAKAPTNPVGRPSAPQREKFREKAKEDEYDYEDSDTDTDYLDVDPGVRGQEWGVFIFARPTVTILEEEASVVSREFLRNWYYENVHKPEARTAVSERVSAKLGKKASVDETITAVLSEMFPSREEWMEAYEDFKIKNSYNIRKKLNDHFKSDRYYGAVKFSGAFPDKESADRRAKKLEAHYKANQIKGRDIFSGQLYRWKSGAPDRDDARKRITDEKEMNKMIKKMARNSEKAAKFQEMRKAEELEEARKTIERQKQENLEKGDEASNIAYTDYINKLTEEEKAQMFKQVDANLAIEPPSASFEKKYGIVQDSDEELDSEEEAVGGNETSQ